MASSLPSADSANTPRSVEQITQSAQDYEYDANIPLRYWLRTASALLKEAAIYGQEHDDETTYLLLFRHSHLILAHLARHPDAKDKNLRTQLKDAEREVNRNFQVLDGLKPKIKERHHRYLTLKQERDRRKNRQGGGGTVEATGASRRNDDPVQTNIQRLEARENRDLALELAQKELSRRATVRESRVHDTPSKDNDLSQSLQALRMRVESNRHVRAQQEHDDRQAAAQRSHSYHYPSMPSRHVEEKFSPVADPIGVPRYEHNIGREPVPPVIPPKPTAANQTLPPPRPNKVAEPPPNKPVTMGPTYTFAPSAYLEGGTPLRTIFLPQTLRTTFLRLAHKSTVANLETCGFLAGTLIANAFFISKLIVPAQTATSDTCEMINESDLFDYVDSENLMILGWIHTHPTQTCFMSSRDLHTHAGYQMMLAESVAIVCAPSKGDTTRGGDWGAYRLTDPPGKKVILNCNKPGVFHPHEVDNIYTDAMRPGHVVEVKGMEFEVVDLRTP